MEPLTPALVEVVLKNLTDRIALALLLIASIFLCFTKFFPQSSIGAWGPAHMVWLWFAVLFPLCYLPTRYLVDLPVVIHTHQKKMKRLDNLTPREKAILAPFIHHDFRIRRLKPNDPVAKVLADDGILYAPEVGLDAYAEKAYSIPDWVRHALKKRISALPEPAKTKEYGDN